MVVDDPLHPRWGALEWAVLAATAALYATAVRPFFGFSADDAYISLRYAASWATGCGPRYSCGAPPVEGYTNFAWVAVAAAAIRAGLDVVPLMRWIGMACGFGALALAALLCRRLYRGRAPLLLPLLVLGGSPFWAVNAVSGLETLAASASVAGAALLSLRLPAGPRPWLAGLAWGASTLVRPEGLALAALTGVWSLGAGLARRVGWRATLRGTLQYGGAFLAVAGPFFLWRVLYYGALVPNTFEAKRVPLSVLLPRNHRLLAEHGLFFVVLALAAIAALLLRRRGAQLYLLLLGLAAAAISLVVHNNFWMPGHRLYLTAALLLAVVAAGLGDLGVRANGSQPWWGAVPLAAVVAVLVGYGWHVFPATKSLAEMHYARDNHPARAMGLRIRQLARPGEWLAIRDAGMVPFFAGTRVNVLDMHDRSLNDRRIARRGWDLRYVLDRDLRFIVFASYDSRALSLAHPVEEQLLRHPAFARYRHSMTVTWNPSRHFFLYVRSDERPPRPVIIPRRPALPSAAVLPRAVLPVVAPPAKKPAPAAKPPPTKPAAKSALPPAPTKPGPTTPAARPAAPPAPAKKPAPPAPKKWPAPKPVMNPVSA